MIFSLLLASAVCSPIYDILIPTVLSCCLRLFRDLKTADSKVWLIQNISKSHSWFLFITFWFQLLSLVCFDLVYRYLFLNAHDGFKNFLIPASSQPFLKHFLSVVLLARPVRSSCNFPIPTVSLYLFCLLYTILSTFFSRYVQDFSSDDKVSSCLLTSWLFVGLARSESYLWHSDSNSWFPVDEFVSVSQPHTTVRWTRSSTGCGWGSFASAGATWRQWSDRQSTAVCG